MSKELSLEETEAVSGGRYTINARTNQIKFMEIEQEYSLKNCSARQVRTALDALADKYAAEKDYEAACVALLQRNGWI